MRDQGIHIGHIFQQVVEVLHVDPGHTPFRIELEVKVQVVVEEWVAWMPPRDTSFHEEPVQSRWHHLLTSHMGKGTIFGKGRELDSLQASSKCQSKKQ